jgi:hypothetical protein
VNVPTRPLSVSILRASVICCHQTTPLIMGLRALQNITHKTPAEPTEEGIQKVANGGQATDQVISARATCCAMFLRSTQRFISEVRSVPANTH